MYLGFKSWFHMPCYKQYLRFKMVLELFDKKPEVHRQEIADILGIPFASTLHVVNTLMQEGIIKICSYDMENGHKRGVYKRIKFDV